MTFILIITDIGYPFGGAEDYLMDTMHDIQNNDKIFWLSFSYQNRQSYKDFEVLNIKNQTLIRVPNGLTENNVKLWLRFLHPDIVHAQGNKLEITVSVCRNLRIPCLIGFHFWNDIVDLDPVLFNKDILENISKQKPNKFFTDIVQDNLCVIYVCSYFMKEVVKLVHNKDVNVVYPNSNNQKKCKSLFSERHTKYITQINIHNLKGGDIFLNMLNSFPNENFFCIQTENMSKDLDEKIKLEINKRTNSCFIEHTENIVDIYEKAKIVLIPSKIDETYCRVLEECLMNGIPVLTSGKGNMSNMLNHDPRLIADINNIQEWKDKINNILENLTFFSDLSYKLYENCKTPISTNQLINNLKNKKNIMMIVPWCDQGLGIQAKNYAKILGNTFNIKIFSFKPYLGTAIELQKDPSEWNLPNVEVFYSENEREKITDDELIDFVKKYKINHCFIPETCWFRIFEITKLLNRLHVKTYAIPNIEIVRKDEIFKHRYFYKILCNNFSCLNLFKEYGFSNVAYIGYGIKNNFKPKVFNNSKIKFMCVGGFNAFTRKMVHKVCKSIVYAHEIDSRVELTVTIQGNHSDQIFDFLQYPFINVIQKHLSYQEILNLYYTHDVNIQVSSHEGLGIGFYESLSTGTPVLTLDTAPHNEIIKEGLNGWIIPLSHTSPMEDNPESLVYESHFEERVLTNKIIQIVSDNSIERNHMLLKKNYDSYFSEKVLYDNMYNAL